MYDNHILELRDEELNVEIREDHGSCGRNFCSREMKTWKNKSGL